MSSSGRKPSLLSTAVTAMFSLLLASASSITAAPIDSISLFSYENNTTMINAPSIDENTVANTRIARLVAWSGGTAASGITFTISDNVNFFIASDSTGGPYIKNVTVFDYEAGPIALPLTITANDGLGSIISKNVTVDILPKNDTNAIFRDLSYAVAETATVSIDIRSMNLVTDADLPADQNGWKVKRIAVQPVNGRITWTPAGTFLYDPRDTAWEAVADSFGYIIQDSTSYDKTLMQSAAPYWVRFTIANVNDETPIGLPDTIRIGRGGTYGGSFSVLANDRDPDNLGGLSASLHGADLPQHGTAIINPDGTFSYTHDGSNTLSDGFSYLIFDGKYTSAPVRVEIGIKEGISPTAQNFFLDTDADGTMDRIALTFDNMITPQDLDTHSFVFRWPTTSGVIAKLAPVKSDWIIDTANPARMYWDIDASHDLVPFTTAIPTGCGNARMITGIDSVDISIRDGMGPVPAVAKLHPGRTTINGDQLPDILIVTFTEEPAEPLVGTEPFLYKSGSSPYGMLARDSAATDPETRAFVITDRMGAMPINGDSIALSSTAQAADNSGVIQNSDTRFIRMQVSATALDYRISAYPRPYTRSLAGSKLKAQNANMTALVGSRYEGIALCIDPYASIDAENIPVEVEAVIFDPVGNVVATIENRDAVRCNGRVSLLWDCTNSDSRSVGAGSYVAKVTVTTVIPDPTGISGETRIEDIKTVQLYVSD